jgi:acyl carrier protein
MSNSLVSRVAEMCASVMNIPTPAPDDDLVNAGYLDSLALVELLFELEQQTGFTPEFDELDLDHLRTPRSIAALVDGQAGTESVA